MHPKFSRQEAHELTLFLPTGIKNQIKQKQAVDSYEKAGGLVRWSTADGAEMGAKQVEKARTPQRHSRGRRGQDLKENKAGK